MTQTRLGKTVGRAQGTVSNWTRAFDVPSEELWSAIEGALDLAPGSIRDAYSEVDRDELAELRDEVAELRAMVERLFGERQRGAALADSCTAVY